MDLPETPTSVMGVMGVLAVGLLYAILTLSGRWRSAATGSSATFHGDLLVDSKAVEKLLAETQVTNVLLRELVDLRKAELAEERQEAERKQRDEMRTVMDDMRKLMRDYPAKDMPR